MLIGYRACGWIEDQSFELNLPLIGPKPGIPKPAVVCWAAERMATSFCSAAAIVVSIAATSPSQPCSFASSRRSTRLVDLLESRHLCWVDPKEGI